MIAPQTTLRGTVAWTTPIFVGAGLLGDAALWRDLLPAPARVAVVTDDRVAPLWLPGLRAALGPRLAVETIVAAGETAKSREQKARIEDAWLAAELGRDAYVVALGGGVVGDLAGFCAATYLRGIPVIQVPTTLVAMVDASIGGKTAVDVDRGKNLIGAFHPPAAVVADVATLASLPDAELRHGMAEVVKHAVIADRDLFAAADHAWPGILRRDPEVLQDIVTRNVRIKGRVVEADERERGLRQILNFGHTVGHALERTLDYALPHGQAVALGICAELRMAERLRAFPRADAERVAALLAAIGLPTYLHGVRAADVIAATAGDKKSRAQLVHYALPNALGTFAPDDQGRYAWPVPADIAGAAIAGTVRND